MRVDQPLRTGEIGTMRLGIRSICLTFLLGSAACGAPEPADVCEHLENCGSTSKQCIDELTDVVNDAEAAGCSDEADAYLSCLDGADTSLCDNAGAVVLCAKDALDTTRCIEDAAGQGAP